MDWTPPEMADGEYLRGQREEMEEAVDGIDVDFEAVAFVCKHRDSR